MKIVHDVPRHGYINVMEILVSEEVEKQLKTMHPRMLKYLKRVEVETFALNRLPALYASSEKGWQLQYEKAKGELHGQIKNAVRQAFAAVQVDPIRASNPLHLGDEDAIAALTTLRQIFKQPDLNWDGVVNRLRSAMGKRTDESPTAVGAEGLSHRTRYRNGNEPAENQPPPPPPTPHWRPGTYGADTDWYKNHRGGGSGSGFDWNDNRYAK